MENIPPRIVPDRDSKYMGMAWMWASFSKDPNTQIGAQIVDSDNIPLGSGYNGPPRNIDDKKFSWCRPPKDNPQAFSKYDVIIHAEINAIFHSHGKDLRDATLYVTAFPCVNCMKEIAKAEIKRVVYFEYQSDFGSMIRQVQTENSKRVAELAQVSVEKFSGNISWLTDWVEKMKENRVFGPQ